MEELIAYAADKILGVPKHSIDYVVHSGGGGEQGFITILFYSDHKPALVAKVSRFDSQKSRAEHENLIRLSSLLSKTKLAKTIEKPYALTKLGGFAVLFKEFKGGTPGTRYLSSRLYRKNRAQKFLRLSIGWLTDFVAASAEDHINSYDAKKSAIWSLTGLNAPVYSEAVCRNKRLFVSPCHGDFVTTNILVNTCEDGVSIIDFEYFTMLGFPVIDLISIIVSTGTSIFGLNDEMVSKTFFKSNWFSIAVRDALRAFCARLNIDIATLISVLPLYSDRAIYLCKARRMSELLPFHEKLKCHFENRQSEIIWRD